MHPINSSFIEYFREIEKVLKDKDTRRALRRSINSYRESFKDAILRYPRTFSICKKVVGIEKIVPTIHDALIIAEVIWGYAKYTMPSYISIIAGLFAYLST